jgi:large subunit ribosomal protein L15
MDNFNLKAPLGANKKKRILGRGPGSGKGGTSGKGNKGQNARAGGGTRPGFEGGQMPLFRRIARRGFSNHPFKKEFVVVNLDAIESVFSEGDTVSFVTLLQKRLIKKRDTLVKILGRGELSKKLSFEIGYVSETARQKIKSAGGSVPEKPKDSTEAKE